ncbi:CubicO group peptidase (beta-lactamase class C family) [Kribbella voronezhensis]|uniref:CubicO group peptidase (Beta-lactamase class C family) n=1 Tax=Kribbella voronezhensis TaxID=2512212 RepID=A0A4R7TDB8_9ACTN|nr:serine hydrolase domain-containing protein [Kribbella voronezhensis]TDU90132.1 CubicO group peptidase (beta-lactamase class C family) [Kribbella voronezhensis]
MSDALDSENLREALAYYDSWLAFNQRYQRIPGVQAAVYAGEAVALSSAYGLADVEQGVELTSEHLFRIASHSKTFTATAVLQLVEQGRLRLDDKAGLHVTELVGTRLGELTLRELLAHAGGITRDSGDAGWWQLVKAFPDREELLAVLRDDASAVIDDNDRFKYSNIGYGLLGLVIEAASGTSYNNYVQTAIVDKLGLSGLGPELDAARSAEYAAGYSAYSYADHRVPIDHVDTRALASATGFFGSAGDLVTYFSAHFPGDDRLLTDKSKREMQHPLWQTSEEDWPRYGLGLQVSKVGKRKLFGHGGGYPGHITRSLADGEQRIAVSVLTNAIDGPAGQLAEGFFKLLDLAGSKERGTEPGLERFTGRFANLWTVYDFAVLGGRLYVLDPTSPDPAAEPQTLEVDGDELRVTGGSGYGSYGESYRFNFGPDGQVESVRGSGGLLSQPIDRFTLPDRVRTVQA